MSNTIDITIAGDPVAMRVLTLRESEEWTHLLSAKVAGFDIPDISAAADLVASLLNSANKAAAELVVAYDRDGVLASDKSPIEVRMTQREVHAALEAMVEAEYPFGGPQNGQDPLGSSLAPRILATFGLPTRQLVLGLGFAMGMVTNPDPDSDDASTEVVPESPTEPEGA